MNKPILQLQTPTWLKLITLYEASEQIKYNDTKAVLQIFHSNIEAKFVAFSAFSSQMHETLTRIFEIRSRLD